MMVCVTLDNRRTHGQQSSLGIFLESTTFNSEVIWNTILVLFALLAH